MALIKAGQAPTLQSFSMTDIENSAKQMLINARRKAEALLAAAQVEAENLRNESREQGFAKGHAEGSAKGLDEGKKQGHAQALNEHRAQMTAAVNTLARAATQFNDSRVDFEANGLRDMIQLALAIATKVTKRQAQIDPQVLVANVEGALRRLMKFSDVRIAVHPAQLATLQAELPRLQLTWPQLQHVQLVEDAALSAGSCRILSGNGVIDGELDAQLQRLAEQVLPTA